MLSEKVQRARQSYGERLSERMKSLAELLARAEAGNASALEDAQRLAHRIYGSAGTFGFAVVGKAARIIDEQLLRVRAGELRAGRELYESLTAQLELARSELAGG
jgi:HPt (histidine-containing phosphotransfer) domain-containing protein